MRYRAPAPDAVIHADLDAFTAIFHRPSGITHLLASPAPEILAALAEEPADVPTLLARLAKCYDLADADEGMLQVRVDEMIAAGLLSAA